MFEGVNEGLVVAELELDNADEAFERPLWLGAEISHEARYYNVALAERPFSEWSAQERNLGVASNVGAASAANPDRG